MSVLETKHWIYYTRDGKFETDHNFGDEFDFKALHREDGPALITEDSETWYQDGKTHRLDGPALVNDSVQEWRINGKPHRKDGPAIIHKDGFQSWWWNGKLHRVGGPAVIQGRKRFWYFYGKRHRLDGPAITYGNGREEWYLYDLPVPFEYDAKNHTIFRKIEKATYYYDERHFVHREDGPAILHNNGDKEWWRDNKLLKSEYADGYTEYHWNGDKEKFHRDPLEGPAVIYPDGRVEYWVEGQKIEYPDFSLKIAA